MAAQRTSPGPAGVNWWFVTLALLAMAIVPGVLRMIEPTSGDDALFVLGARQMNAGGTLYIDFWDHKQPGIYLFAYIAGKLTGFTNFSMLLLELVYWLAAGLALSVMLRHWFTHQWMSALVPVLMLATYFARAGAVESTQVEMLINAPLLLMVALLVAAERRPAVWFYALAGLCAGFAAIFKLAYGGMALVIFAAIMARHFLAAIHQYPGQPGVWLREISGPLAAFGAASLILPLGIVVYYWSHGALDVLLWTSFVAPMEAISQGKPASIFRLGLSGGWFGAIIATWLPLVVCALLPERDNKRHPAILPLLVWLAAGCILIVIQRFAWWPYHFQLLYGPFAVLAILGLDRLPALLNRDGEGSDRLRQAIIAFAALPLFATLAPDVVRQVQEYATQRKLAGGDLAEVLHLQEPKIAASVAELRTQIHVEPGMSAYAFGHPGVLVMLHANQAVAVNGWSPEALSTDHWMRIEERLREEQPELVFVEHYNVPVIARRNDDILDWLNAHYEPVAETPLGTWHRPCSTGGAGTNCR